MKNQGNASGEGKLADSKAKPTLDALKYLADRHRSLHQSRIDKEFHLVISMLTLYAIAIGARFSTDLPKHSGFFVVCVWVALLTVAVAASVYLQQSASANRINQKAAERLEDMILPIFDEFEIPSGHPGAQRWMLQVLIVMLGAMITAVAITL